MEKSEMSFAKLSRPSLHAPIARIPLFTRLDHLRAHPLIWISAPPGSGKTTLVASYLEARKLSGIWYHVDAGDSDPSAVFYYLGIASKNIVSGESCLPLLTPEYFLDVAGFSRRFFRELFSRVPEGTCIVLDNQQEAGEAINKILVAAVAEIPRGMNLLVISREQPSNTLARLIANEQIGTVDWNDLRFTIDETKKIAAAKGIADPDLIAQWHAQTGGWAAGITFSLVTAMDSGKKDGFPSLNSRDLLLSYFDLEVFQRLAGPVQALLLATALLPRVTPAMAIEITGNPIAPRLLDDLYRKQCFIARHSEPEVSYSYHEMFRDFLGHRFAVQFDKDRQSQLRVKAAKLLDQAGDHDTAVTLFAQESRSDEVSRIICSHADNLNRSGRWQTLNRWLTVLPADCVDTDPWLTYWQGVASKVVSPTSAKALFAHAYDGFVASENRAGQFLAAMAATDCIVAMSERYQELDVWLAALSPSMLELEMVPDTDRLHAWYSFLCAAICRDPGNALIPTGIAWLNNFLERKQLSSDQTLTAGVILIMYSCYAVDHALGNHTIARVRIHAASDDSPPDLRFFWFHWLGLYHMWRIEYPDARRCWEACFDISRRYGFGSWDFLVELNMVCADVPEDRLQDAEARLARLRHFSTEGPQFAKALYWLGEIILRFQLKSGDVAHAMDSLLVAAREAGLVNFELVAITDVAAVCLLRGEDHRAEMLLTQAKNMSRGTVMKRFDGQLKGLEAAVAYRHGDMSAAKQALDEALDLSKEVGYCGCLLWIRFGFSALFADALTAGVRSNEINDLIRRYEIPAPSRLTESWPWPIRIRVFGELEISVGGEILRPGRKAQHRVLSLLRLLLADGGKGLDSAVIADKLWPDAEGDTAFGNLRVTMKRLRDLLGHPEAVRIADGKLSLNDRICWVDLWAFEDLSHEITQRRSPDTFPSQGLSAQVFSLYRAPLLVAETEYWLVDGRDRERSRFCRTILAIANQMEHAGDEGEILHLFERSLEIDPAAGGIRNAMARLPQRQEHSSA